MKAIKLVVVIFVVVVFSQTSLAQNRFAQNRVNYLEYWAIISQGTDGATVRVGFMQGIGKTLVASLPVKSTRGFEFRQVGADVIGAEDGVFVLKYKIIPADCAMVRDVNLIVLEFFKRVALNASEIRQKSITKDTGATEKRYVTVKCKDD